MSTPSRRTIALGAVWAVPAIAVGAAAPAMAASKPNVFEAVGTACKLPGQSTDESWGYRVVFRAIVACIVTPASLTIGGDNFVIDGGDLFPHNLGAGDTITLTVNGTNSANGVGLFTFSVDGQAFTEDISFPSFHPCDRK